MQKYLIAAVLVVSFTAPVLAVETFYVIFDNTMKGCTIVTTDLPTRRDTKSWVNIRQTLKLRRL